MTILANGCPKSGTHAVMTWLASQGRIRCPGLLDGRHVGRKLELRWTRAYPEPISYSDAAKLPDTYFLHAHVHASHELPAFKVITIFRDPRNVLISYCRHEWRVKGRHMTPLEAINRYCGRPLVEVYRGFLGWKKRGTVLRYEDLPDVGDGRGLYAGAQHDSNTYTGSPSRWQDVWTDEIDHAWRKAGGCSLVRDAGYA